MHLLAFDTSTERMSIAVARTQGGQTRLWETAGAGGTQASVTLLPTILDLMAQAGLGFAELDAICFGCGPGAFTGLRTACSVAQGLGFGAQGGPGRKEIPVLPVDTLLVLAEEARHIVSGAAGTRVLSMLDARMNEIYSAPYRFDGARWERLQDFRLCGASELTLPDGWNGPAPLLAGNVFTAFAAQWGLPAGLQQVEVLPTASAMLRLAPALLADGLALAPDHAMPTYIRDKVAHTTSERAAIKAAAAG